MKLLVQFFVPIKLLFEVFVLLVKDIQSLLIDFLVFLLVLLKLDKLSFQENVVLDCWEVLLLWGKVPVFFGIRVELKDLFLFFKVDLFDVITDYSLMKSMSILENPSDLSFYLIFLVQ